MNELQKYLGAEHAGHLQPERQLHGSGHRGRCSESLVTNK